METKDSKTDWIQLFTSYPARMVAYGLLTMAVFQYVYLLLQEHGCEHLAAENGPIELAQVACLLIAVAGISLALRWAPIGRAVLVATGAIALYAAARESDSWFESAFFEDSYKWLVGLPAAIVVVKVAYSERQKLVAETLRIAHRPGSTLFTFAGIYLCFFCQMIDRPLFWPIHALDTAGIARKALIEESAELFAYLLIAFSGFEAVIAAYRDRASMLRTNAATSRSIERIAPRPRKVQQEPAVQIACDLIS